MAYLNDRVLDFGLNVLDVEATDIYVCSAQPSTYTEAITTYALGNKSGISIGAPAAGTPTGRTVTVAATTGGTVTATGTATHYAIVDTVNTRLLAAAPLAASQVLTSGNPLTTSTVNINLPSPA